MHGAVSFLFAGLVIVSAGFVAGQEPHFTTHVINPAAEYPACAVFDVNKDGHADIVSGGFWYAGPKWEKHFLRDVEVIRGRFDDYSNLPLDVNADGWLDIGDEAPDPRPSDPPLEARNRSISRIVDIPARLAPDGYTCFAFNADATAACLPTETPSSSHGAFARR